LQASEGEVITVMRISIVFTGLLATLMALTIKSIYGLWYLCADLVYVILFPQLLLVVYMEDSNTYGCLSGYAVGLVLRLSGGEPMLHFPALIHYPMYVESIAADGSISGTQYFPFRTMSMMASLLTIVCVSLGSEYLFRSGRLPVDWDILKCIVNIPPERINLPKDTSFNTSCQSLVMHKIRGADNGMTNPMLLGTGSVNGFSAASTPNTESSHLTHNTDSLSRDYNSVERN
jgi:high affinity choline transporter 7